MTVVFRRHELPIAYSMIDAASRVRPRRDGRHPFDKFFLLWTAFNHIYAAIATRQGISTELILREDGTIETFENGNVKIPKVKPISARAQIALALGEFDAALKNKLINHESTKFFINRIPFWQGKKIEYDAFGQRVNGVINVNYTTSAQYPVWSPIDPQIYESYLENPENEEIRDFLARQIVELLYTISKNLMHISNSFDDSNDIAVAEHGLPLLECIVASFTH